MSMYQSSIPPLLRMLDNLLKILAKAEQYAKEKNMDLINLTSARLAPDMFELSRQIHLVSDSAKGCAARLAGVEVPSFPDTETTFSELQQRISKTVDFLKSISSAQIDGSEDRSITLKLKSKDLTLRGDDYLFKFVLPNFYFHLTIAYAILRHEGVPLGKMDYLGSYEPA